jgi:hypothetical protein
MPDVGSAMASAASVAYPIGEFVGAGAMLLGGVGVSALGGAITGLAGGGLRTLVNQLNLAQEGEEEEPMNFPAILPSAPSSSSGAHAASSSSSSSSSSSAPVATGRKEGLEQRPRKPWGVSSLRRPPKREEPESQ